MKKFSFHIGKRIMDSNCSVFLDFYLIIEKKTSIVSDDFCLTSFFSDAIPNLRISICREFLVSQCKNKTVSNVS